MVERVKTALSFYTLVCVWEHEDAAFDSSGSEYEIRGADGSVLTITGELRAAEKYDDLRARAAIEAMREPTSHETESRSFRNGDWSRRNIEAYIDAALNTEKPEPELSPTDGGFQVRALSQPRTGR